MRSFEVGYFPRCIVSSPKGGRRTEDISLPLKNSIVHASHGGITGSGQQWGEPGQIDEMYLKVRARRSSTLSQRHVAASDGAAGLVRTVPRKGHASGAEANGQISSESLGDGRRGNERSRAEPNQVSDRQTVRVQQTRKRTRVRLWNRPASQSEQKRRQELRLEALAVLHEAEERRLGQRRHTHRSQR